MLPLMYSSAALRRSGTRNSWCASVRVGIDTHLIIKMDAIPSPGRTDVKAMQAMLVGLCENRVFRASFRGFHPAGQLPSTHVIHAHLAESDSLALTKTRGLPANRGNMQQSGRARTYALIYEESVLRFLPLPCAVGHRNSIQIFQELGTTRPSTGWKYRWPSVTDRPAI